MSVPTRKSSRNQKKNDEQPVSNRGRSRSRSANTSVSRRRNIASIPITEKSQSPPRKRKRSISTPLEGYRALKKLVDGRIVDVYCWVCHKLNCDSSCSSCPRVYHKDCIKKLKGSSNESPSCECGKETVNGRKSNWIIKPHELRRLLQCVMQEALKEEKKNNQKSNQTENSKFCRLFQAWPSENDDLCNIMDVNILLDNMNGEYPYLSSGQFFLDVKWIYHNCYILYGPDNEITQTALKLEKNFKQELTDMEACPQCYYKKYSKKYLHMNTFTDICKSPHDIIWAKLRGSPFWPAKCLGIYNGYADVRFFGTHDRAYIPVNNCYKISKENPLKKDIQQAKYRDAIGELAIYISNFERCTNRRFSYKPQKTALGKSTKSAEKSNKHGHHRLNNSEHMDKNVEKSDPKDTKVRDTLKLLEKIPASDVNKNIAEEVDSESSILCQMTFTAEEDDEPANELNNSKKFMNISYSKTSLNPNLPLSSVNETPVLLSTTEAHQNSCNFTNCGDALPVITSVSARNMPLNEHARNNSSVSGNVISQNTVSDGYNSTNSLPVITSAVSARGNSGFLNENFLQQMSNFCSDSSANQEFYKSFMKATGLQNLLEEENNDNDGGGDDDEEEADDDIKIIHETERPNSIDFLKNPLLMQSFTKLLMKSKPRVRHTFLDLSSVVAQYLMYMWIDVCFGTNSVVAVQNFMDILKKSLKKQRFLKKALDKCEKEKLELEKALVEAKQARLRAENGQKEAERERAKLEEGMNQLKSEVEHLKQGQNNVPKSELLDIIIKKASQQMQSRIGQPESVLIQEIDALNSQLNDAQVKLKIKEREIGILREEKKKSKSSVPEVVTVTHSPSQTDITIEPEIQVSNSALILNPQEHQDFSQLNINNLEIPYDVDVHNSSQHQQTLSHADLQMGMQRNMFFIGAPSNIGFNTSVVQQVIQHEVSESTTLISVPSTGVMNAAGSTVVVPLPSNPLSLPPCSSIYQNTENPATNLNSASSRKGKAKLGSEMNLSMKRRKKNM